MNVISTVMLGNGLRLVEYRRLPESDDELRGLAAMITAEDESGIAILNYCARFIGYQPFLIIRLLEPPSLELTENWIVSRKWLRERLIPYLPKNWRLDLCRFEVVPARERESGRVCLFIVVFFIVEEIISPEELAKMLGASSPRAALSSC